MKKFLIGFALLIGAICANSSTQTAAWDYGPGPQSVVIIGASSDYGTDLGTPRA